MIHALAAIILSPSVVGDALNAEPAHDLRHCCAFTESDRGPPQLPNDLLGKTPLPRHLEPPSSLQFVARKPATFERGTSIGSSEERAWSKIVRSTTRETFAPDIAANELGLVKIDVEGFESEVMSGMGDAREKFPVILMELHSWQSNKEVGSVPLVEFLLDNYHVLDTAEALYPRWGRRLAKDGFTALSERLDGQEFKKTDLLLVHRNLPGATKLAETLAELQFYRRD